MQFLENFMKKFEIDLLSYINNFTVLMKKIFLPLLSQMGQP